MTPIDSVHSQTVNDDLVVRRHERLNCKLPAMMLVRSDSAVRVALARTAGDGSGHIPAMIVDGSEGGVGCDCDCFLPRGAAVELHLYVEQDTRPLVVGGIIQRVTMTSRAPKYYIGIAFSGDGAPSKMTIERLLTACRAVPDQEVGRA